MSTAVDNNIVVKIDQEQDLLWSVVPATIHQVCLYQWSSNRDAILSVHFVSHYWWCTRYCLVHNQLHLVQPLRDVISVILATPKCSSAYYIFCFFETIQTNPSNAFDRVCCNKYKCKSSGTQTWSNVQQ